MDKHPTFSRGGLPHFAGINMLLVTHHVEEAVFLGQRVVVLATFPGRVVADIPVPLGDDRELTTKRDPEFLALRASIEDMVRAHHATARGR